ncbi:hypothetical protein Asal01_01589 [Fodinibius salicampi]
MFAAINGRLIYLLAAGGLCVLLVSSGCHTNSKQQLHEERLQILNTLLQKYAEGDSIAVYEESIQDISISLPKEKLATNYLNNDSLTISQEDLEAWQKQWENYEPAEWKEWGWDTDYLISREEFPEYYDYSVPPPGFEVKTFVKIVYFSMPIVGENHAFVNVATSRGKHSWVVVYIIMEKKNGKWIYHSSKGLFTS